MGEGEPIYETTFTREETSELQFVYWKNATLQCTRT